MKNSKIIGYFFFLFSLFMVFKGILGYISSVDLVLLFVSFLFLFFFFFFSQDFFNSFFLEAKLKFFVRYGVLLYLLENIFKLKNKNIEVLASYLNKLNDSYSVLLDLVSKYSNVIIQNKVIFFYKTKILYNLFVKRIKIKLEILSSIYLTKININNLNLYKFKLFNDILFLNG